MKHMGHLLVLSGVMVGLLIGLPQVSGDDEPKKVLGYINEIPKESPVARVARHRKVAERREGTPIMVHRGATRFAPENTLEAFAAAMDNGADGVEIDIRRSKDGMLYLMHDGTLDRTTTCAGKASERTYYEIASCRVKGAGKKTRVPTLAALLVLARQRAMLLHLDVKEAGLQDDLIKMFGEADVWDHIVEVNAGNAERIRGHKKVRLLAYKGWFPENATDPNSEAIKNFLASPGDMVFLKYDPSDVARALGRKPVELVPLPEGIRQLWSPTGPVETVYITKTGSKYHRDGCRHLAKSAIPISRKDAEAQGYTACKVCKP